LGRFVNASVSKHQLVLGRLDGLAEIKNDLLGIQFGNCAQELNE
jgi:hypothetical protein